MLNTCSHEATQRKSSDRAGEAFLAVRESRFLGKSHGKHDRRHKTTYNSATSTSAPQHSQITSSTAARQHDSIGGFLCRHRLWLVVPSTAARGVLCYDMCPLVFSWCEQHRHRSSHFSDDRTHSNRSPLSQPATTSWFAIETRLFTCLHHFRCNSPVLRQYSSTYFSPGTHTK